MIEPPDRLETERLLLRSPVPADATTIFRSYANDPEVTRYLSWRPHGDLAVTEALIEGFLRQWETEDGERVLAICHNTAPDEALGTIGLRITGHQVAFGYVLARSHWGRGIMPEALGCLVSWCFSQPSLWRAQAFCDAENRASARVMEKAGMRLEGRLGRYFVHPNISSAPRDCLLYARVRDTPADG